VLAPQDRLDVVPPGILGRNVGCGEGDCCCSSGHTHGGGFVFRYVFVVGVSLLGVWFSGDVISRSVAALVWVRELSGLTHAGILLISVHVVLRIVHDLGLGGRFFTLNRFFRGLGRWVLPLW